MNEINLINLILSVILSGLVVFFVSNIYYISLSKKMIELGSALGDMKNSSKNKRIIEFLKSFILPLGFVFIVVVLNVNGLVDLIIASTVFWIVFPVNILLGSVLWEKVPPQLAMIHAGDWLLKLILISLIFGLG